MSACFQLIPIDSDQPEKFGQIDEKMCRFFGVEPSNDQWYMHWYPVIGFNMALGLDYQKLRETFPEYLEVINWLADNYTINSFQSSKWR